MGHVPFIERLVEGFCAKRTPYADDVRDRLVI